jgi:hypothetical protein
MMGNDVAWAVELLGPWVAGFVQSAVGTNATIIDGGESYRQRTSNDFQNAYNWLKTGFGNYGGRIVPAAGLTSSDYNANIQACVGVYDGDVVTITGRSARRGSSGCSRTGSATRNNMSGSIQSNSIGEAPAGRGNP